MTKSKKQASNASVKVWEQRSFYRLTELSSQAYSVEALLDWAANGKLALSFIASNAYLIYGVHPDGNGIDELPQGDEIFSGIWPLLPEYIWGLIASGETKVEFTSRSNDRYCRVNDDLNGMLVQLAQVVVRAGDWQRFLNGQPPELPSQPGSKVTNLTAALVCLYADAKDYIKNDKVVVAHVMRDIENGFTSAEGVLPYGLGKSTLYDASDKIEQLLEVLNSNRGG